MIYHRIKSLLNKRAEVALDKLSEAEIRAHDAELKELLNQLNEELAPRICVVKQDINEDLYCCGVSNNAEEIVSSTLLRTGPVALFAKHSARFMILETVEDEECEIWKERATVLNWDSLEFYRSYQKKIPGRDYGQSQYACKVDEVDWSEFDIVISVDNSIPERITKKFPDTLWCYYVREIKAPAYKASLLTPLPGQDCVLNHGFGLRKQAAVEHVVEFPYHLHYFGCFHEIFNQPLSDDCTRQGVFVDHHTMVNLSKKERTALEAFGNVSSTIHDSGREIIPTSEKLARRTMDDDLRSHFMNARFFLMTSGQRTVFGTAVVEAIAFGTLVIGSAHSMRCGWILTKQTSAKSFDHALTLMEKLSSDTDLYQRELVRQRLLINHLCYTRPMIDLLMKLKQKRLR